MRDGKISIVFENEFQQILDHPNKIMGDGKTSIVLVNEFGQMLDHTR